MSIQQFLSQKVVTLFIPRRSIMLRGNISSTPEPAGNYRDGLGGLLNILLTKGSVTYHCLPVLPLLAPENK